MSVYGSNQITTIKLRPLVRSLGLIVGAVAGIPCWIGCLWFLLNPSQVVANLGGFAFACVVGGIVLLATRGWMRIGAKSTERMIILRGWWKSVSIVPADLAHVRKVDYLKSDRLGQDTVTYRYSLEDHRGEQIGEIPASLEFCTQWPSFLQHLHLVAGESRKKSPQTSLAQNRLASKAIEEWTSEDFARYEAESDRHSL